MSLRDETAIALDALGRFSADRRELDVTTGDTRLRAILSTGDRLAVGVDEFCVVRNELAGEPLEKLRKLADSLSRRLSYLLEPIGTVEVDGEQCTVQMRSIPPTKDPAGTSYYELLVQRGGKICLMRYLKPKVGDRVVVPAFLTREVFLRLVEDFATAG